MGACCLVALSFEAEARPQFTGWKGPAVAPGELLALFAATTPSGRHLGAAELKPLILHAPMPGLMGTHSRNYRLKIGVFLLSARPDGTVAKVEMLQSTGQRAMDGQILDHLKRWRFRPNSVTEVRIPALYGWMTDIHDRYYPTPKSGR